METYLVGGAVRDEIMDVPCKDFDYTCVLETFDVPDSSLTAGDADPFQIMASILRKQGFEIFLETPQYFTVRARFPKGHINERQTADFVLARREGKYVDGRRPSTVSAGTLMDDISRRDYTCNAIAKDEAGNFIDPFNGRQDIAEGVIRAVGNAFDRLNEDALRAVRALRFSVTKGFRIDPEVRFAMETAAVLDAIKHKISDERINDELSKMFRFDTVASLRALNEYPALTAAIFAGSVSLNATMKTRGRGKSAV